MMKSVFYKFLKIKSKNYC